jgi:ring-1,2-phenylacetyl-CoA epoxidase subunit PaaB
MTQWPRYEVFEQEKMGRPHQNAGSVHAPDGEMAMQMARDVFVRRPACYSLWVVPAAAIFARTAQELAVEPAWEMAAVEEGTLAAEPYYVFQKRSQRRAMTYVTHVGEVQARSAAEAMMRAVEQFSDGAVFVWWVCPARLVIQSQEEEAESMFAPAHDKRYREPKDYHVMTEMMEVEKSQGPNPKSQKRGGD